MRTAKWKFHGVHGALRGRGCTSSSLYYGFMPKWPVRLQFGTWRMDISISTRPGRRCRIAQPNFRERWPARLVAQEAEGASSRMKAANRKLEGGRREAAFLFAAKLKVAASRRGNAKLAENWKRLRKAMSLDGHRVAITAPACSHRPR